MNIYVLTVCRLFDQNVLLSNIANELYKVCDVVAQWLVTCPCEWITAWHAGFESQLDGWSFTDVKGIKEKIY